MLCQNNAAYYAMHGLLIRAMQKSNNGAAAEIAIRGVTGEDLVYGGGAARFSAATGFKGDSPTFR